MKTRSKEESPFFREFSMTEQQRHASSPAYSYLTPKRWKCFLNEKLALFPFGHTLPQAESMKFH